jgi:hypothetical protein
VPRCERTARPEGLSAYIAVTAAYWAFMLTDGALRMLVLLHFHTLGFSPVQLAYLFVLYEIAGVVTNLSAGWIAARFGLTRTLYAGLALQVVALAGADAARSGLGGGHVGGLRDAGAGRIGRGQGPVQDVVEIGGQAAGADRRRRAVPLGRAADRIEERGEGAGFLLGAALSGHGGFNAAVLGMAAVLAVILAVDPCRHAFGPAHGPQGREVFRGLLQIPNVNWLSAARVMLFGARDVWFVVGIPIYFYAVLSDGSEAGNRAAFFMIGSFMAVWIILYGAVQAAAPRF